MAKRSATVAVPTSVSTGLAQDVQDLVSIQMSLASVGTATYQIQVSYDKGTSFAQHGSDVTASGEFSIPDAATQVRVKCTAYTSGTPVGAMGGVVA